MMRLWLVVLIGVAGCGGKARPAEPRPAGVIDPRPLPGPEVPEAVPEWMAVSACEPFDFDALDELLLERQAMYEPWARQIVQRPIEMWESLVDEAITEDAERRQSPTAALLRAFAARRADRYRDAARQLEGIDAVDTRPLADYLAGLIAQAEGRQRVAVLMLERAARTARRQDVELAARYRLAILQKGEWLTDLAWKIVGGEFAGVVPDVGELGCGLVDEMILQEVPGGYELFRRLDAPEFQETIAARVLAKPGWVTPRFYYWSLSETYPDHDRRCIWDSGSLLIWAEHPDFANEWFPPIFDYLLARAPGCRPALVSALGHAARVLHVRTEAPQYWPFVANVYERHVTMTDDPAARLDGLHHQSRLLALIAISSDGASDSWVEVAAKAAEVVAGAADEVRAAEAFRLAAIAYHNALVLGGDESVRRAACSFIQARRRELPPGVELGCGE